MANVTAQSSFANITVTESLANITVTDNDSGSNVNVSVSNSLINVSSTSSNVTVSEVATISNTLMRAAVSAVDTGGDGSFSYDEPSGVFTYTGPNQAEANARITAAPDQVRAHISVTDTGGDGSLSYSNTTGVITYTGPSASEVRAHIDVVNEPANVEANIIQIDTRTSPNTIYLNWIPNQWANGTVVTFRNITNANLSSTFNNLTVEVGNIEPAKTMSSTGGSVNLYTSFPGTPYDSGLGIIETTGGNVEYSSDTKGNVSYDSANGNVSFSGITLDDIVDLIKFPGQDFANVSPFPDSVPQTISPIQFFGYDTSSNYTYPSVVENSRYSLQYKKGDLIFNPQNVERIFVNQSEEKVSLGNDPAYLNTAGGLYSPVGWPNSLGSGGTQKILDLDEFRDVYGEHTTKPLGVQTAHGTIVDDIQEINIVRLTGGKQKYTVTMVQDSTGGHDFTSNIHIQGNVSQDVANGFITFLNDVSSLDTTAGAVNIVEITQMKNITDGTTTDSQRTDPKLFIEIKNKNTLGLTNAQVQAYIQENGLTMTNVISSNSNITTTANLSGATLTADSLIAENVTPSGGTFTVTGEGSITGNLVVGGNIDYTHVNDLYVANTEIVLNANSNVDSNVQITVNRPVGGSNAHLKWDELSDRWLIKEDTATEYELVGINTSSNAFVLGSNIDITTDNFSITQTSISGGLGTSGFNLLGSSATNNHGRMFIGSSFGGEIYGGDNIVTNRLGNVRGLYFQTVPTLDTTSAIVFEVGGEARANITYSNIEIYAPINSNANITTSGNIEGNYIIGDGSQLQNLPSGISNAQAQAYINTNGLALTTDISSTANVNFTGSNKGLVLDSTGKLHFGNIAQSHDPISGFTAGNHAIYYITEHDNHPFNYEYFIGAEVYADSASNDDEGIMNNWSRGRGTLASPAGPNDGDKVVENNYFHYGNTQYPTRSAYGHAGTYVYYDEDIQTYSDTVMPLTQEFYAFENGNITGTPNSLMKLRPNGSIEFNSGSILEGNPIGTANIQSDGTITGTTLTDGTLSINSGNITSGVAGTFSGQVQAGTFTDGTFSVTGGNFSTVGNIDATGYFQTNGLIKTFGGDIETTTGNIITLANINAGGGTLTGVVTSNSNITTTANMEANYFIATEEFIGDLEGAISEKGYNNTGGTLTKGQPVYVSGAQGDQPNIALANAQVAGEMPAVGIVKENISAGATGQFVVSGVMAYASHGFTTGAELFINGAGALQETAPTGEANLIQKIGKVVGPNHILVQGAGRTNATPNLDDGKFFLGNASNQAVTAVFTDEANTAIAANLAALTSSISSDSLIKTTGNLQINPDTQIAGLKGLTYDSTNNFLGLGTTTPGLLLDGTTNEHSALHIQCNDEFHGTITIEESRNTTAGPEINFIKAWDSAGTPAAVADGNRLMELISWGYDGTTMLQRGDIRSYVDGTVATGNVPVGWGFQTSAVGNVTPSSADTVFKVRSNGAIQVGAMGNQSADTGVAFEVRQSGDTQLYAGSLTVDAGNIELTGNLNATGATLTGAVTSDSNITTTANISGNYILGNGSQLTGIAGSYGNSDVANFLDSDTMTANIEYTGNLLVGAPAANVVVNVQAYFGNVNTGSQDQFQPASNLTVADGAAVLFNGQAANTTLTFLNGNVYYVTSAGGGVWNLFEDSGLTTQLQSGLDNESGNINGLTAEYVGTGVSKANIEGTVYVTDNVEAEDDVKAGNALFGDKIYPFTGGGTIGFTGVRMSDVGLGGSAGTDFFWPETGRPDAGSLLIAGTGGNGYWAPGVHLQNEDLNDFQPANIISATATSDGVTNLYQRARGNVSAPTALENVASGNDRDRIARTEYFGHDGTNYLNSFNCSIYADANISAGGVANIAANVMPLSMEFSVWEDGELAKNNLGYGFPIMKLRADRSIEFNSPNPQTFNNPQGNANITADGSFNTNASIVAVGDITGTTVNATNVAVSGTSITTANNTVMSFGSDPDHNLEIQAEHARLEFEADVDSPHLVVYTYRNGTVGGTREYYRSSGSAASPTAIGNNDIVLNEEYFGHDGTSFGTAGRPNANFQVFQDDTVGTSTGVVPLSMEWTVNPEGHGGSTFGKSCIKIASDRTLHLQDVNTRGFSGAYDGNVKIVEDGSITTKANVTVGDRLQLKSYSNTEILALTTPSAGEMVYNSTDNRVAYYNGTNWQNLDAGTTIT